MLKNRKAETILVTRFSALGDVAMTIPVIYSIACQNENSRFIIATKPLTAKLFVNRPTNVTVVPVDTDIYKGAFGMWKLYREIDKQYNIDAVADLHDVLRTKLLRFAALVHGKKIAVIDKEKQLRKNLIAGKTTGRNVHLKTAADRYAEVFSKLGYQFNDTFNGLFDSTPPLPQPIEPKKTDERWIGIAPFAAHKGKIYPASKMREVIRLIDAEPVTRIFVFGAGKDETDRINDLINGCRNAVNMAHLKTGLTNELALMSHLDLMVTMDSGNMHMASLVNTPVISIWGATDPCFGFYGYKQDPQNAVQQNLPCRPCSAFGAKPCTNADQYKCLDIPPFTIVSYIKRLLACR